MSREYIDLDADQISFVSNTFFEECNAILSDLDQLILKIEESPDNSDLIATLFRKIHTLKGSVGAVPGGQLLGSLAHEFEALIDRFRKSEVTFSKEAIDLFLHSSKLFKILSQNLQKNSQIPPEELSETIEVITRYSSFQLPDKSQQQPKKKNVENKSRKTSIDEDGVWLSSEQLNHLVKVSSELVVIKNLYQMLGQSVDLRNQPDVFEKKQTDLYQTLNKLTDILQDQMVLIQKITMEDAFANLQALLRQTCNEVKKEVKVHATGFDLAVDKGLASDLYQSLVHILRNSIDHGLETKEEREAIGKTSEGNIYLICEEKNGHVLFTIKDDGKGLDKEKILQKAIEKGLVEEANSAKLTESEIFHLIFHPGFSTKDKISKISGRGVGMDVVKQMVDSYEGKIHLDSIPGKGLTITLDIPIPRKIMVEKVLLCKWMNFEFAIPINSIMRVTNCHELTITEAGGYRFCQFDKMTLPLLNYKEIKDEKLYLNIEEVKKRSVVFIRNKNLYLALLVDEIDKQMDLVIRGFDSLTGKVEGFRGSSVLADDKITYVVDPMQLTQMVLKAAEVKAVA